MIGIAMYMTIITLWQKGEGQRKIARTLGCSRDAVRGAIAKFKGLLREGMIFVEQ